MTGLSRKIHRERENGRMVMVQMNKMRVEDQKNPLERLDFYSCAFSEIVHEFIGKSMRFDL
jgi:hypothetical protein